MFFRILIILILLSLSAPYIWAQKQLVDRVIAVVNDEAITQSEMDLSLRPLYEDLKKQYEGEELAHHLDEVRLKLLNQMIDDQLVYQEAKTRGITVEEEEIDQLIEDTKTRFASEKEFEIALTSQGYSLNDLREKFRRQIAIRKLHDAEIRSQIVVSPQKIEDFYKNRKSEFAEEESVKIRSITVKKNEEVVGKGLLDEAAKQKIQTIEKRIREGESFEKLAGEFSEDANVEKNGMAGWIKRGTMIPVIDETLFKLKAGEISPILETSFGYHLFKVEEKKISRIPPLEGIRDKIHKIIFQEEAQVRFKEWMNQLKTRAYISIR